MNLRKYIVLLLFVGGLLVSCNHENNVQENNLNGSSDAVTEGITAKTVEFVGVEHNEMLDKILSNKILNNPKVIEDICNLEKIIENDKSLNTKQLVTLLSATSVAKHSYEYWSKNISKWEKIADKDSFARSTSRKSAAYHATDIVIGDIAGAIAGAAGAWALNLYFGPGTAAYGGVVLAGAVSGSVYVAADKALHWLNDKINGEDEDD